MKLCRVLGSVTSTLKHDCYRGQKLLVVQPIDGKGADAGTSFLAVDRVQAGEGDTVLVMSEGNGVRQLLGVPSDADLPIRSLIVGIVDRVGLSSADAGTRAGAGDREEAS
jgi:ethanolamine utilization protein EutN